MPTIEDIEAVIARVEAHSTNLLNGAPHQRSLGEDLQKLVEHAKVNTAAGESVALGGARETILGLQGQLATAKTNLDNLLDVKAGIEAARDQALDEVEKLKTQMAEMEKKYAAVSPLGIASTAGQTMADIKAAVRAGDSNI